MLIGYYSGLGRKGLVRANIRVYFIYTTMVEIDRNAEFF